MESHWPLFRKFIRAEKAVGGPDCQFTLMLEHARHHSAERMDDPTDVMWLIGCYGGHHCAMPAYEVWDEFSYAEVIKRPELLHRWLKKHWRALPVRREMRSHRMLDKRHQCLVDFAQYAASGRWRKGDFERTWNDSQQRVKYYGRYMSIKVLELMHRTVRPDMPSIDIRAAHAWSPRAAMALLYPKQAWWIGDRKRNDADTVADVEKYATRIYDDLHEHDIDVSYFELQGLLCNYKEMLYGRFYPGAGHDEDIEYMREYARDFDPTSWWKTRKRIFRHKDLGEINGWNGLRPEVGERWMQMRIDRGLHLPPRGS
jgi:hypothetical protein